MRRVVLRVRVDEDRDLLLGADRRAVVAVDFFAADRRPAGRRRLDRLDDVDREVRVDADGRVRCRVGTVRPPR